MRIFDENYIVYGEVLSLLKAKAKVDKQRNIDPELKYELDKKAETIHKNLKLLHKGCLSNELSFLIAEGFKNNLLTKIPKGSILLLDYVQLCGFKSDNALETINESNFIISRIETRGNKQNVKRRFPNYDQYQTLILPPDNLHKAILANRTIYNIVSASKNSQDVMFDCTVFNEIILLTTSKSTCLLGTW